MPSSELRRCAFLLGFAGLMAIGAAEAAKPVPPPYLVKKKTWYETLLASREARARHEAEQAKTPGPAATKGPVALGAWYVVEPFIAPQDQKVFDYAFPPEKEPAFTTGDATKVLARTYGKLGWKARPDLTDGIVQRLGAGGNGASYLYRALTAAKPTTLTGFFGGDDGIRIWLNGKLIYSEPGPRGVSPNQDKVKLHLNAGVNHLMLKVPNYGGAHGFYFHTRPKPVGGKGGPRQRGRDELWDYLTRLHRKETVVAHEMALEAGDGIWQADWTPGKLGPLGQRYLRAIRVPTLAAEAKPLLATLQAPDDLWALRALYYRAKRMEDAVARIQKMDFVALRLAIADLAATFPERYTKGTAWLAQADALEKKLGALKPRIQEADATAIEAVVALGSEIEALRREALLANPLLDVNRLLVLKRDFGPTARTVMSRELGMPSLNSHNHNSIANPANGWDNEIAVLDDLRGGGTLTTLFKPEGRRMVCDVDLHWDATRMLFSMPGTHDRWHVFETSVGGGAVRQLTPKDLPDIDHFEPCYLPSGKIVYCSTAGYHALPCENGSRPVAPLYLMDADGSNIRQITFEQDTDFSPSVRNDGRLLYLRWEYSDTPHYYSRILFHCNPDGTEQMEYYGSGSYFPNAFNYARAVPGHPTQVVGIVGGHHGISRSGRLMILDPSLGRHEADGVVQEIPGRGKTVEPLIRDALVNGVWPQFLHPWPLSEKYCLVAAKPDANALWGIYLADVFDNMLLVKEIEGSALLEPIPFASRPRPPVIMDKVDLKRKDATVYLMDIYKGVGLAGVPRGAVKRLRLFAYHFGYWRTGGHASVGVESSWDIKRVLGTVPVEADGSAYFRIPANTPISVQPLDDQGRSLQLMRTWLVGMPGERVGCVGCHERQSDVPHNADLAATRNEPSEIQPWHGPPRPFAFVYEVQPVLDRHCVACHDGKPRTDGKAVPNFADRSPMRRFSKSYMALQPYVRRPGPESDIHTFRPMEYHASTSELVQMLAKGHHNVQLDRDAWETLYAWIDLNAPFVGRWEPQPFCDFDQVKRRIELAKRYANVDTDPEAEYQAALKRLDARGPIQPVKPKPTPHSALATPHSPGWPFDAAEAWRRGRARAPHPRPRRRREDDPRPRARRLIRHGPGRRLPRRAAPDHRPRRAALLDRPHRGDQPAVRPLRPRPRQPLHRPAVEGPRPPRLPGQPPRPARHPHHLAAGHGLLPMAQRPDGAESRTRTRTTTRTSKRDYRFWESCSRMLPRLPILSILLSCPSDPLLLSSCEEARMPTAREAYGEHPAHAARSKRDIVTYRQVRKKIETLENHAYLGAHLCQRPPRHHRNIIHADFTLGREVLETIDTADQRRLA